MKVQKFIIAEKSETNDQERSIVGWGSKPVPDRDGELIEATAWKLDQYRRNPVLMLSHDYSAPPVGKCLWIKSDTNGLKFKAQFANTERGKEMYELYKGGFMNGFSVGFSINKATDHPTDGQYKSLNLKRVYHDVDLLEISCVAIPACPDALIEQVKSGKIVSKDLKDELAQVIEIVEKERVTKPEVMENYVRIPVDEGHKDCNIRTMTLSAEQGIKALYCVDDKTIITYLFDKEKWSMDEAKKWIEQHKKDGTIFFPIFEEGETIVFKSGILIDGQEVTEKPAETVVHAVDPAALLQFISEHKEEIAAMLVQKKEGEEGEGECDEECPAGGTCGEDFGDYAECESCPHTGKCRSATEKACGGGKKPKKKAAGPDGTLSVYDIVGMINNAINPPEKSGAPVALDCAYPYVLDVYLTDYPNGYVIYSDGMGGYKKSDYTLNLEDGSVTLSGVEDVEQNWVHKRYPAAVEKEKDETGDTFIELKDEEPILEIVDKAVTKEERIEIDGELIKGAITTAFQELFTLETKTIVEDTINRMKGRVV